MKLDADKIRRFKVSIQKEYETDVTRTLLLTTVVSEQAAEGDAFVKFAVRPLLKTAMFCEPDGGVHYVPELSGLGRRFVSAEQNYVIDQLKSQILSRNSQHVEARQVAASIKQICSGLGYPVLIAGSNYFYTELIQGGNVEFPNGSPLFNKIPVLIVSSKIMEREIIIFDRNSVSLYSVSFYDPDLETNVNFKFKFGEKKFDSEIDVLIYSQVFVQVNDLKDIFVIKS